MILRIKKGRETQVIEDPDLVIVEDKSGNPIAVAAKLGMEGVIAVSSIDAGEETFNRVLHGLGIDKTVVRQDLTAGLRKPETLSAIQL
jgi:hypothetical protein